MTVFDAEFMATALQIKATALSLPYFKCDLSRLENQRYESEITRDHLATAAPRVCARHLTAHISFGLRALPFAVIATSHLKHTTCNSGRVAIPPVCLVVRTASGREILRSPCMLASCWQGILLLTSVGPLDADGYAALSLSATAGGARPPSAAEANWWLTVLTRRLDTAVPWCI